MGHAGEILTYLVLALLLTMLEVLGHARPVSHVTILKPTGPLVSDDKLELSLLLPQPLVSGEPPELFELKMPRAKQSTCPITVWVSPGSPGSCSLEPAPRNSSWPGAGR